MFCRVKKNAPGSAASYVPSGFYQVLMRPWCCVQDCLDAFTETETLEEEEGYNCQSCKRKGVCATKKLTLYRCPPVLVLHLKRFNASAGDLGIFSRFSAMSKVSPPISKYQLVSLQSGSCTHTLFQPPLSPTPVCCAQIVSCMPHIGGYSFVHGDLKAENEQLSRHTGVAMPSTDSKGWIVCCAAANHMMLSASLKAFSWLVGRTSLQGITW